MKNLFQFLCCSFKKKINKNFNQLFLYQSFPCLHKISNYNKSNNMGPLLTLSHIYICILCIYFVEIVNLSTQEAFKAGQLNLILRKPFKQILLKYDFLLVFSVLLLLLKTTFKEELFFLIINNCYELWAPESTTTIWLT